MQQWYSINIPYLNGLISSHCLNQCWYSVNYTLRNKLQWNLNRNSYIFIQENAFENVVSEMASILFRPQCVDELMLSSLDHIKIQILILMLPYVHEYVIWVLMGWILWWFIYGWWSVPKTNMASCAFSTFKYEIRNTLSTMSDGDVQLMLS